MTLTKGQVLELPSDESGPFIKLNMVSNGNPAKDDQTEESSWDIRSCTVNVMNFGWVSHCERLEQDKSGFHLPVHLWPLPGGTPLEISLNIAKVHSLCFCVLRVKCGLLSSTILQVEEEDGSVSCNGSQGDHFEDNEETDVETEDDGELSSTSPVMVAQEQDEEAHAESLLENLVGYKHCERNATSIY